MQRAAAGFVFRNATLGLGLKNILFILVFLSVGLVEPVRFNRFQTLETKTELNQNFFVIF